MSAYYREVRRIELTRLYGRLLARFGADHVIRRLRAGWLRRAAHARVERALERV